MKPVIRERDIKVLEFDAIRGQLAELTVTPMARERALKLLPADCRELVALRQRETAEGKLLCQRSSFSPPGAEDIKQAVLRSEKGGVLNGSELAAILIFLKGVSRWQRFFKAAESIELYPLLNEYVSCLDGSPSLARELEKSLDPDGRVLDDASPLLSSIRRQQRVLQERIRDKLDSYLRDTGFRRYLQEGLITIRNGRFVLPVKQEYRQRVEGVLHDQSSSGATLFIEPMAVVQLQNQHTALSNQAEREVERILSLLSVKTSEAAENLLADRELYTELDFIVARGRLSLNCRGVSPEIIQDAEPRMCLNLARHPLLTGEVVPLELELGGDRRVLVVTGPNTGGKTVALKTIGLMAVMTQCGLHLPAGAATALPVFDVIRADIGDEQSIAQSLSTFSAHMKNIISILEEAGPSSLVLFDELGAGTDPSEGAALAMAILANFSRNGTLTIATTHINELKLFAQVTAGMQNAAMEFSQESLEPTYRLLQGVPGQSNAFVIAGRLGLPESVLHEAKGLLHREHQQVEEIIASLVEDQRRFSRDSSEAARDRARAEELRHTLELEKDKLKEQREEIIRQAREEARSMVRRVKATIDELVRELRQIKEEGGSASLGRAEKVRLRLHELRQEAAGQLEPEEDEQQQLSLQHLTPGTDVMVQSLKQKGEIISITGGDVLVQVGPMKVHVPLRELRPVRGKKVETPAVSSYSVKKDLSVSSEVDLRGMTVDEALQAVDKFIDDALWAGLSRVTLIHGKGTGKLKEALRSYLKELRHVDAYRRGVPGEGGDGVTVVELGK